MRFSVWKSADRNRWNDGGGERIEEFKWVYVPSFFFWLRFKDEWPSRNIEDKLFRNKLWDNLAIETVAEAKMSTDNAHWENSH